MKKRDPELQAELDKIDRRPPPVLKRSFNLTLKRVDDLTLNTAAKLSGQKPAEFVKSAALARAHRIISMNYRKKGLGLREAKADAKAGLRVNPKTEMHRAKWRKR